MRKPKLILLLISLLSLLSCHDGPYPDVDTLYLKGDDREKDRIEAIPTLYNHYKNSAKDRSTYEVVAKGNAMFVINYVPGLELLTLSGDPGSGWSSQFKNVDEAKLQELIRQKLTFGDINDIGSIGSKYDSLLVRNKQLYNVRTNGHVSN